MALVPSSAPATRGGTGLPLVPPRGLCQRLGAWRGRWLSGVSIGQICEPPGQHGLRPIDPLARFDAFRPVRSLLSRLLSPDPHGVSATHTMEFRAFGKERWIREFAAAGLDVVAVLKGPVCSGYGFGLNRFRLMLEKAGFASEYAYVAVKRGARSPCAQRFQGA